ncbi:MAG: beta-propeller domain-containing protein [Alteromonadaceae bacterium]|nr:beta-propeller domain-containing protein [Alteromonadaceae bacterium]
MTTGIYVIDLSDNLNPMIFGELEFPDYSSYLHPISDSLLLGIGQNVNPNRFPTLASNENDMSPVIEGAKVTLFDVSDPTKPREIKSFVYEDGYTPVEYNYHALTYLATNDGKHKFALPVSVGYMKHTQVKTV